MANIVYNIAREKLASGQLDLATADLWLLLTYGYVPEIENHKYVSDASSFEVSGSGYTRVKLQNVSLTKDTVNNRMVLLADDVPWALANFTANGAIIFIDTGDDSTASLITFLDFGSDKRSQNTVFKIVWNAAEGIINLR
jgi:hypothetical protein